MVPGAPPLLCGKVSRDIKQELDKLSSDVRTKKLRWFSECFSVSTTKHAHFCHISSRYLWGKMMEVIDFQPPGGSHNLWDLVAVIKGQDDSLLPQNYGQGIMHMKHLVRFKTVSADEIKITSGNTLLLLLLLSLHSSPYLRTRTIFNHHLPWHVLGISQYLVKAFSLINMQCPLQLLAPLLRLKKG